MDTNTLSKLCKTIDTRYKYLSVGQIHSFVNVFKYFSMYFKYKYLSYEKNNYSVFPLFEILVVMKIIANVDNCVLYPLKRGLLIGEEYWLATTFGPY